MSWEWPNTDKPGLARFALEESAKLIELSISRYDQPQDPKGRRQIADAIYSTLQGRGVHYSLEKFNTSSATQLIRTPSEIFGQKEGTCLDLALLFCGVCFGYELLPLIILIEGHALAAVSLNYDVRTRGPLYQERRYFKNGLLTDADALRQLVNAGAYLAVECTGLAETQKLPETVPEGVGRNYKGLLSFERAVAAGAEQLSRADRPFLFGVDIAEARELGFKAETDNGVLEAGRKEPVLIVGKDAELDEVENAEIIGHKGDKPRSGKIDVARGAKIKRSKGISIIGETNER
jgi:hypothetical protein